MGHAGAIISGGTGTAAEKIAAMRRAGIHVVKSPADMGAVVARVLKSPTGKGRAVSRSRKARATAKPRPKPRRA